MSDVGIELPKLERVYPAECHIDARPDGDYALRILRYYRRCCDERWAENVDGSCNNPLWIAMNEHQEQRAEELDNAIEILEKARMEET